MDGVSLDATYFGGMKIKFGAINRVNIEEM